MPAREVATTKGEAEALLPCLLANASSGELYGTIMPKRNTLST